MSDETTTAASLTVQERLAKVLVAEGEAEKKRVDDEAEMTLAYFELKSKLSAELGVQGRDFQIVNTVEGLVAVKRVDAIHMKRWDDAVARCVREGKATTTAMALQLAVPGVIHPDAATFQAWVLGTRERPGADGIAGLAVQAIQRLHGNVELEVQGKR